MCANFENDDPQKLAATLYDLITVLIRIFPEGVSEELEKDVYLTLLQKAQKDAKALQAAIHSQGNENQGHRA